MRRILRKVAAAGKDVKLEVRELVIDFAVVHV
jgi:hypothetical protein